MAIFDFYVHYEYAFAATQLVLLMFGMGSALTARELGQVFLRPRGLIVGLSLQLLVVPLSAWAVIGLLARDPGLAVGLALCAVIPCAAVANVFTYLARGQVALSVVLVAAATLLCLATAPLLLDLLVADSPGSAPQLPVARIAQEMTLLVLLPMLLGMVFLRVLPRSAGRVSPFCIRAALLIIVLIVIGASGAGRLDTEAFGHYNIGVVLLFAAVLVAASAALPRLLRLPAGEGAAINLATTVRNTNLGLLMKASAFPAAVGVADPVGDNVLFTILLYGGLSLLLGPVLALLHRRSRLAATAAAASAGLEAR
jgi:BASS family bile acid:Na+ symporter